MGMFVKDLKTWVEPSEISDDDSDMFQKALKVVIIEDCFRIIQ